MMYLILAFVGLGFILWLAGSARGTPKPWIVIFAFVLIVIGIGMTFVGAQYGWWAR